MKAGGGISDVAGRSAEKVAVARASVCVVSEVNATTKMIALKGANLQI